MTDRRPSRRHLILGAGSVLLGAAGLDACSDSTSSSHRSVGPSATAGAVTDRAPTGTAATGAPAAAPSSAGSATASPAAGPDITRGTSGRPEVALTFHGAGETSILRSMLADLAGAEAKITVLAIGTWLAAEPQVARMILDGGHDLGNHTWSHRTMPALSPADIGAEVDRAAAELRTLTGSAGRWFRPSGTPHSTPAIRAAAVAAGYGACLGYDVDPLDYTDPGPDAIVRAFRSGVRAGSIVSLHLGHPGTLAAMPRMLSVLSERGLSAVTATDLVRNA